MNLLETLVACAETFVIDFDGTLVDGIPYQEVLKTIATITGQTYAQLYERYQNEWLGLHEAEAYHASLVDKSKASEIRSIYRRFREVREEVAPLPKTVDILRRLVAAKRHLYCWTRGDDRLQRSTIRRSGLEQFFERILVAPTKTRETVYSHLVPALNGAPFIVIGDLYDQDIEPVAGLAEKRVWIYGSKANQYRITKAEPATDIIAINTFADLLQPVK